ncbi:MAG: leucyl-tRNA synthetase [Parcubacteria group bacterium Greene0714_7]|nr:MAG: leucyl-tRNA synthetase [Parcubacteria group bacterium Greene0714_7]
MQSYDHKKIEKKWRKLWEESGIYKTSENSSKPKHYVLDMFPYPSALGLHTGHVEGYAATDIYSRFKRMKGFSVLHPMGWDAFGLPAENYAIKTNTPPRETTNKAIDNFRNQIQRLGLSYDWSREIGTHNPDYYKWTQWLFLFLFENGLAEKRMGKVNWCPTDQTVLANEQTVSESGEKGVCVRCGTKIIQRELSQWFFKITDFADVLIDDLNGVDWPESTKINQRNWIGRKEGVIVTHKVKGLDVSLDTFSAYPAWLFADTYMVLAPEHPIVKTLVEGTEVQKSVEDFVKCMQEVTTIDRTNATTEKEGIFTGRFAIDSLSGKEFPIWIANFALMDFGTGIIRCSSHDIRDLTFAKKYGIPLSEVVERESPDMPVDAHANKGVLKDSGPFTGRTINNELIQEIIAWIESNGYGHAQTTYRLRDWLISRQRYWGAPIPVVYDPEGKAHGVPKEHLPWLLPEDVEYLPKGTSPLGTSKELLERTEKIFGKGWKPEIDTMDTFVCSSWYFLRFADPHNEIEFASKEVVKKWLPVDLYMGGAEHTVLHLMYARFITKALQKFGYIEFGEPFSKLRHQGMILAEDGTKMSKSKGNVINPDEISELYGADTLRIYEMFMGPLEAMKPWSTKNIIGSRRFLERVWRVQEKVSQGATLSASADATLQQTIKKVAEDIELLSLNTAVSQMMICVNAFEKEEKIPAESYESMLLVLAPFAPHMTEELWETLGHTSSIHQENWPVFDESKLEKNEVVMAVQVGGKVKGTIVIPRGATEEEVIELVRKDVKLGGVVPQNPSRMIFVPNRVVNFIP